MDFYDERDYLLEKADPDHKSNISDFFQGCSVLITGATGFIGCLILEKLLRCCPEVKKVFLIVRDKKGKTKDERLQEIFKNEVFSRLWKFDKDFVNKVKLISGDMSLPNLGLSDKDEEQLLETNIVIHSAASVRFDEHIRNSFIVNVCATLYLLELSKKMKNLKVFTHISTAYCHTDKKSLKEEFFPPHFTYKEIKTLIDSCSDDEITGLMPLFLKGTTTYSLMKSITEDIVKDYAACFPICVTRPSIVISTYSEPIFNWINSFNGFTALLIGGSLGVLHCFPVDADRQIDLIPADKVVSAVFASTWDAANRTPEYPVYNVASGKRNPISWRKMHNELSRVDGIQKLASFYTVSEKFGFYSTSKILIFMGNIFLHLIPGLIIDAILTLNGKKPLMTKLYRKAAYMLTVMDVYGSVEWFFDDEHLYSVWSKMSPTDKINYNFNMDNFSWTEYFCFFLRGFQIYLFKEKLNSEELKKARRRRNWLYALNYVMAIAVLISVFWFLCLLKCWLF